jgi:AcrR family transcriptional regulator
VPAERGGARTDPRVTRTRGLIEDAFLAVMEEKGFEGLSVQDVADKAGINRVTFYAHFADTYELLRHAVRTAFEADVVSKGLAERSLDMESTRDLFLAVCSYVAGLHEHCKPPHDHLDWVLGEVVSEYCAELFQRWSVVSGRAAALSRAQAATAAGSSLYALASRWGRMKRRGAASAFVESTLPIVAGILGLT